MSANEKAGQWVLIILSVLAMTGSALAWTVSTFATKTEVNSRFHSLEIHLERMEKKLDRMLEK